MSAPERLDGHGPFDQEDDRVRGTWVLVVFGGAVALAVVLVIWASLSLAHRDKVLRPSGNFYEIKLGPPHKVQAVRQHMFAAEDEAGTLHARQRALLERWDWVDEQAGTVRMPVDRAIDLVVAESKK